MKRFDLVIVGTALLLSVACAKSKGKSDSNGNTDTETETEEKKDTETESGGEIKLNLTGAVAIGLSKALGLSLLGDAPSGLVKISADNSVESAIENLPAGAKVEKIFASASSKEIVINVEKKAAGSGDTGGSSGLHLKDGESASPCIWYVITEAKTACVFTQADAVGDIEAVEFVSSDLFYLREKESRLWKFADGKASVVYEQAAAEVAVAANGTVFIETFESKILALANGAPQEIASDASLLGIFPDGNLYISAANSIVRYNVTTKTMDAKPWAGNVVNDAAPLETPTLVDAQTNVFLGVTECDDEFLGKSFMCRGTLAKDTKIYTRDGEVIAVNLDGVYKLYPEVELLQEIPHTSPAISNLRGDVLALTICTEIGKSKDDPTSLSACDLNALETPSPSRSEVVIVNLANNQKFSVDQNKILVTGVTITDDQVMFSVGTKLGSINPVTQAVESTELSIALSDLNAL